MNGTLLRRLRLSRTCRSFRTRAIVAIVVLNFVFIFSMYHSSGRSRVPTTSSPSPDLITAASVQDTGTPLLDRLDRFRIHRDVGMSGSRELEQCDGWTAGVPDVNMEEPQRWQVVVNDVQDTFVFSAYFDSRSVSSHTDCLYQLTCREHATLSFTNSKFIRQKCDRKRTKK